MCNFSNSKMRRHTLWQNTIFGSRFFFIFSVKIQIQCCRIFRQNYFLNKNLHFVTVCAAAGHFAFLSLKKTRKIYADSQGRNSIVMTWHKWKLMMEILCCDIHQQSCLNIEKYYKISRIIIDWFIINIKDKLLIEICS